MITILVIMATWGAGGGGSSGHAALVIMRSPKNDIRWGYGFVQLCLPPSERAPRAESIPHIRYPIPRLGFQKKRPLDFPRIIEVLYAYKYYTYTSRFFHVLYNLVWNIIFRIVSIGFNAKKSRSEKVGQNSANKQMLPHRP